MRWGAIGALVIKDLRLFTRNRFFAFTTVLGAVFFVGLYLVMPQTIVETIALGIHAPGAGGQALAQLMQAEDAGEQGLEVRILDTDDALRAAVLDGSLAAGWALPETLLADLATGRRPMVTLYLRADTPPEVQDMMEAMVEALVMDLSQQSLLIEVRAVTLGPEMAGMQIPHRDRMRPLFAVMMLMMEIFGLAALLSDEIQTGAARALLATPLSVRELFIAKGCTSLLLSFSQAVLVMWVIGGLRNQPAILLVALFLGSILVTGIGFLLAASSQDMLSVMGTGAMALIALSVPAVGVIFPGMVTEWARIIPSHYLATVVHQAGNLGAGWGQVWQYLLILLGFDLVIGWAGVTVLKRRFS